MFAQRTATGEQMTKPPNFKPPVFICLLLCLSLGATDIKMPDRSSLTAFCGSDSAKACAEHLGVTWRETEETANLERSPIASFREISTALGSLNFHTIPLELTSHNVGNVAGLFLRPDCPVVAVGWRPSLGPGEFRDNIGHFFSITNIERTGAVATFDATSSEVGSMQINADNMLPLLLISKQPISDCLKLDKTSLILEFFASISSNIATTVTLASTCLLLCLSTIRLRSTRNKKIPNITSQVFGLRYRWMMAVGLTVVVVSLYVVCGRKSATSNAERRLDVAFTKMRYHLGEMLVGGSQPISIDLTNKSSSDVNLTGFEVSCGCINIHPSTFLLKAGARQTLDILFSTISPGEQRFTVKAIADSSVLDECTLEYNGIFGTRLLPRTAIVGSISKSANEPLTHWLTIDGYRGASLDVVSAENMQTDSPLEIRVADGSRFTAGGTVGVVISIKSNVEVSGIQFASVILKASSSEQASAESEIRLTAEVGIEIVN